VNYVAYFMDWVWAACGCRAMSRNEYQIAWVANKRKTLRLMKFSATSTELLEFFDSDHSSKVDSCIIASVTSSSFEKAMPYLKQSCSVQICVWDRLESHFLLTWT